MVDVYEQDKLDLQRRRDELVAIAKGLDLVGTTNAESVKQQAAELHAEATAARDTELRQIQAQLKASIEKLKAEAAMVTAEVEARFNAAKDRQLKLTSLAYQMDVVSQLTKVIANYPQLESNQQ